MVLVLRQAADHAGLCKGHLTVAPLQVCGSSIVLLCHTGVCIWVWYAGSEADILASLWCLLGAA